MQSNRRFAFLIFIISVTLSIWGIVFIYTGSYFYCIKHGVAPYAFAFKQGIALFIGLVVSTLIYRYGDYRRLAHKRYLWSLYGLALFLLLAVLIFGKEVNNSKSWIFIGGFSIQPAELAKVLVILFVSGYIKYKWYDIQSDSKVFVGFVLLSFFPVFLILLERDLGSATILSIVILAILFISGLNMKYVFYPSILGTVLFVFAVATAPYRLARIKMLLEPIAYFHASGKYNSYQLVQAFVAIAKGGLTGMGIGQGEQSKFMFLTFPFSDFIYAHIAEEAGTLGAGLVLLSFFVILYLGLSIADRTDEKLGKFMALGLTLYTFLQAMVHMGVNVGLVPTTGITLPFMSLGGTSLVSMFIAVGFLMNIAKLLPKREKINMRMVEKGRCA